MSIGSEIRPVQAAILRVLHYTPEARFSELNTGNISSDHFTFHVKKLLELGLIEKSGERYRLTPAGKEFTNRFDTDTEKIVLERQAKIGALVICTREENGQAQYLAQQRLKQPFYGFHGFITGKVKWGEQVLETAARELREEAGLAAKLTLVGVEHKMDYSPAGDLLEDKYFFLFRGEEPEGTLTEKFEGGRNFWTSKEEILKLPDLFDDVSAMLEAVGQDKFVFHERKYTVAKY